MKSGNSYKIVIFYPFYMQIIHNSYLIEEFTKIERKLFFGNFGASAEESKFSLDAKESDSPGAPLRRAELFF